MRTNANHLKIALAVVAMVGLLLCAAVAMAATTTGTNATETLKGTAQADNIAGGAGNDTLNGRGSDDQLYGDSGSDVLFGYPGNDYLEGGRGADTLNGGSGDDYINGADGQQDNDTVIGGDGYDKCVYDVDDTGSASCEVTRVIDLFYP